MLSLMNFSLPEFLISLSALIQQPLDYILAGYLLLIILDLLLVHTVSY